MLTIRNPLTKFSAPFHAVRNEKSNRSPSTLSGEEKRLFTFAPDTVAQSSPTTTTEEEEEEENSQENILLHGTPSKKDFLDQLKKLRENDQIEEETKTDHDLQSYTSTQKVAAEEENIVSERIDRAMRRLKMNSSRK